MIKNANKYLDPLKLAYEVKGSSNQHFIQSLKDLDTTHARTLSDTTLQIRELIKENIFKNSDTIKKTAEKLQSQFTKIQKIFLEKMKATDKAYDIFLASFEVNEENFRNGEGSQLEKDLWYT